MKCSISFIFVGLLISGCSTQSVVTKTDFGELQSKMVIQKAPTLVFESGCGDGDLPWMFVTNQLRSDISWFSYSRAGYAGSSSKQKARDGLTIVNELHQTLEKNRVPKPYILVGHSLGGTYNILFAKTYPNDVAGVILVDARSPDFDEQCKQFDVTCEPPKILKSILPGACSQELEAMPTTLNQIKGAGDFPNVPLVVLTAGRKIFEGEKFKHLWLKTQSELLKLSSQSKQTVCESCGHYIQREKPAMVVKAIEDLLNAK